MTAGLIWALAPVASKLGLIDHPGGRKAHQSATPLAGGPAIFIVVYLLAVLTLPDSRFLEALGIGGLIMLVTGMIDDRSHLSAGVRIFIQIAACLAMMIWSHWYLTDFGRLMWDGVLQLHWLAWPVTIFAALGVINSFNMIDGMDGLAGAIFLVAASGMALFAGLAGDIVVFGLLLIFVAAVIGFMALNARHPWNPKARIFLGDAGSLFLGFVLAWCAIRLGSGEGRAFMPITAVWLVAVPLLDTSTLMWRRWRSGQSAFDADRYHLHHAFLRAGYSVGGAWLRIVVLSLFLASVGVLLELGGVPDYVSFYAFMVVAFTYYFYMKHCWRVQRLLGHDFIYQDFMVEEVYE